VNATAATASRGPNPPTPNGSDMPASTISASVTTSPGWRTVPSATDATTNFVTSDAIASSDHPSTAARARAGTRPRPGTAIAPATAAPASIAPDSHVSSGNVTTATASSSSIVPTTRSTTTACALDRSAWAPGRSPRPDAGRCRHARTPSPTTPPGSTAFSRLDR
jgi:hypothetical protein